MGSTVAMGYAESVRSKDISLDMALLAHLRSNHYPPLPSVLVGPCKRAIVHAECGEWDTKVRLPKGMTWRGQSLVATSDMVESCHLDAFVESDE